MHNVSNICIWSLGALYICTEDVFPNKRLMQMVHKFGRRNADNPVVKQMKFTDSIFIEHAGDLVIYL